MEWKSSEPKRGGSVNRRSFVAMTGAAAMWPAGSVAQTGIVANPDVVIVGAGASGIAAAHELTRQGVSFVILEAATRVGGRAYAETETFGVPYDHGAHWVQNQDRNPYFVRAQASGGRFYKAPERYQFHRADRAATPQDAAEFWGAVEAVMGAIGTAGRSRQDVAPSTVIPDGLPWGKTAEFYTGPWIMGKEMTHFSCEDWWNSAGSVDYYHAEGYGKLVADHAAGLPVMLETPVTRIRWGAKGVDVDTRAGTIRAKAVILTVSTGVLAAEKIVFDPPLPVDKQEAIHGITMGYYNHIALHFSQDIFGMGSDGYVFHKTDDSLEAFGALVNASGSGLAYCDVGGDFARELELAGQAAAIDFVVSQLRWMIGSDVDKYLTGATASDWGNNPHVLGCYASAEPGQFPMRAALRAPVADRLFFAGEACHADLWATVGGADVSGTETAADVARMLG